MESSVPRHRGSPDLLARLRGNPLLVDTLVAAGLTAVSLVTIAGGALDFGRADPLGLALVLLQTLPLVFRRRAPVPVFLVTLAGLVGQALFATGSFSSSLGALVALFTVAERCERRVSAAAALLAAGAIAGIILYKVGVPAGLAGLVQSVLTVLVVWLVGSWAQERRQYVGTVEERALRAERDREQRARLAVTEERERIARELHDIVAHEVSVIVVSAGAGLRALDRRPADARHALEIIDASGRRALLDMRRMLGILGGDEAPRSPMPGLARLGELLERVRAAGLRTELSVDGIARPLDPGVELSAYRIVQESLTNTLKHAPDARAAVAVRYAPDSLAVEITDDGGSGRRADPGLDHPDHVGRGLIGMRERVAMFGGSLEAGPHGRGFRVLARLPLDGSDLAAPAPLEAAREPARAHGAEAPA